MAEDKPRFLPLVLPVTRPFLFNKLPSVSEDTQSRLRDLNQKRTTALQGVSYCAPTVGIQHISQYLPAFFGLKDALDDVDPKMYQNRKLFCFSWSSGLTSSKDVFVTYDAFQFEYLMILFCFGCAHRNRAAEMLADSVGLDAIKERAAEIGNHLRRAAGIFQHMTFVADSWQENNPGETEQKLPEYYREAHQCLTALCLAEAQQVSIYLAAQKGVSPKLLAKLCKGVQSKFGEAAEQLHSLLENHKIPITAIVGNLSHYISLNVLLYKARACKYAAQSIKEDNCGLAMAYTREGQAAASVEPPKGYSDDPVLDRLVKACQALAGQLGAMYTEYEKENNLIYFHSIPSAGAVPPVEGTVLKSLTVVEFRPPEANQFPIVFADSACVIL